MLNETSEICRTCLMFDNALFPIYDTKVSEYEYIADVLHTLNLSVTPFDGLPQSVCQLCLNELNQCYLFRTKCANSEKVLRESLGNDNEHFDGSRQANIEIDRHLSSFNEGIIKVKNEATTIDLETETYSIFEIPEESTTYSTKNDLELSTNQTNKEKPFEVAEKENFKCEQCEREFREQKYLTAHINRYHENEKKSEIILNSLNNQDSELTLNNFNDDRSELKLNNSNYESSKTLPYKCKKCHKGFTHLRYFSGHMRRKHSDQRFECNFCKKSFILLSQLMNHEMEHRNSYPYKCDICSKPFKYQSSLTSHKARCKSDKIFGCNMCDRLFGTIKALKHHKIAHASLAKNTCEICQKTFKSAYFFDKHQSEHDVNRFTCNLCGQTFKTENYLRNHVLTKHPNRKYSKNLTNNYTIKDIQEENHESSKDVKARQNYNFNLLKKHKGNLKKCMWCPKEFISIYYLKRHQLVHTGEKPFKCELCEKSFTQKHNLKNHILITHADRAKDKNQSPCKNVKDVNGDAKEESSPDSASIDKSLQYTDLTDDFEPSKAESFFIIEIDEVNIKQDSDVDHLKEL